MAFTDAQKAQIRRYMGDSLVGSVLDTALESAIATVEALGDGGETETHATALLTSLGTIETNLGTLWTTPEGYQVDETTVDVARGRAVLCAEGRRLVGQLADIFDYTPKRDVFSPKR